MVQFVPAVSGVLPANVTAAITAWGGTAEEEKHTPDQNIRNRSYIAMMTQREDLFPSEPVFVSGVCFSPAGSGALRKVLELVTYLQIAKRLEQIWKQGSMMDEWAILQPEKEQPEKFLQMIPCLYLNLFKRLRI